MKIIKIKVSENQFFKYPSSSTIGNLVNSKVRLGISSRGVKSLSEFAASEKLCIVTAVQKKKKKFFKQVLKDTMDQFWAKEYQSLISLNILSRLQADEYLCKAIVAWSSENK